MGEMDDLLDSEALQSMPSSAKAALQHVCQWVTRNENYCIRKAMLEERQSGALAITDKAEDNTTAKSDLQSNTASKVKLSQPEAKAKAKAPVRANAKEILRGASKVKANTPTAARSTVSRESSPARKERKFLEQFFPEALCRKDLGLSSSGSEVKPSSLRGWALTSSPVGSVIDLD